MSKHPLPASPSPHKVKATSAGLSPLLVPKSSPKPSPKGPKTSGK